MTPIVTYRLMTEADVPFVFSSWLKSQRHQGDRRLMTNRVYFDNEKKRIERILEKARTVIAHNPEDENHIYAYAVIQFIGEAMIIHFAYTKGTYQRLGILKTMLQTINERMGKEQVAITHITPEVASLRDRYNLIFNPYLTEAKT
jgi:hypothetical protein